MHFWVRKSRGMSDVLFDVLLAMERYRRQRPECYEALEQDIEKCKAGMKLLRTKLAEPTVLSRGRKRGGGSPTYARCVWG
jgi:hypothetical protein